MPANFLKTNLIKIGNSHGIRLPKTVLDQLNFQNEVEMKIESGNLIIRPAKKIVRETWENAFSKMSSLGDDVLLDSEVLPTTEWDQEWEW